MVDEVWLEAASVVASDADADLRMEAADVYAAEAARTRLVDLSGPLRVQLRSGQVLTGRAVDDESIADHLVLGASHTDARDRVTVVIPTRAVVLIDGSAVALRQEEHGIGPRSIASWLRERWHEGDVLRILDRSGATHLGALSLVGADYVRLESGRCLAIHAVDAWSC